MPTDIEMAEATWAVAPANLSAEVFEQMMDDATKKAKILTKVIQSQSDKYVVHAAGQEFLRFEAWSTLARGYGWTAGVETITDVLDTDGHTVIGVEAYAVLRDNMGTQIGGAPARCMMDEPNWSNKPLAQVASMAGTRAASKALRIGLSWVVVLAGYNPTPAEEFERDSNGEVVVANRQPSTPAPKKRAESPNKGAKAAQPTSDMEDLIICPLHGYDADGEILLVPDRNGTLRQVEFFKTGRMKNHAHPIDGTDPTEWCNRYDVVKLIETGAINTPITVPPVPEPIPEPEPEPVPAVAEIVEAAEDDVALAIEHGDVEVEYRALAIEHGYQWEDFVEQVLPANSLENFLAMGGTIKILEARMKRLEGGANA